MLIDGNRFLDSDVGASVASNSCNKTNKNKEDRSRQQRSLNRDRDRDSIDTRTEQEGFTAVCLVGGGGLVFSINAVDGKCIYICIFLIHEPFFLLQSPRNSCHSSDGDDA